MCVLDKLSDIDMMLTGVGDTWGCGLTGDL